MFVFNFPDVTAGVHNLYFHCYIEKKYCCKNYYYVEVKRVSELEGLEPKSLGRTLIERSTYVSLEMMHSMGDMSRAKKYLEKYILPEVTLLEEEEGEGDIELPSPPPIKPRSSTVVPVRDEGSSLGEEEEEEYDNL